MKIKKIGHSCFIVDIDRKKIMTDPGKYFTTQNEEKNIDIILISHEHSDHFYLESLRKIIVNNPDAVIVTNNAVGKLLTEAKIKHEILEDQQSGEFAGVYIEAHGDKHMYVRPEVEPPQNTGYFIGKKVFYPGDAFINPNKPIEVLALPINANWLKIGEVFQYAKEINPRAAFPVHDGTLNEFGLAYIRRVPFEVLNSFGIDFKVLELGKEEEF